MRLYILVLLFLFCFCSIESDIPTNNKIDLEYYKKYIVHIHYAKSTTPSATGLLLNDGIHILTCEHAINLWKDKLSISYLDKEELMPVSLKKSDAIFDLALLESEKKIFFISNKPLKIENNISINQNVFTYGAMYGHKYTFLRGYISYPLRKDIDYTHKPYIQIMGLAYSGMSGAPVFLFDNGKWIGIIRGVFGFGIENGNSMVIPVSTIKEFLKDTKIQLE
jgi:S1-C subfamily serine protease